MLVGSVLAVEDRSVRCRRSQRGKMSRQMLYVGKAIIFSGTLREYLTMSDIRKNEDRPWLCVTLSLLIFFLLPSFAIGQESRIVCNTFYGPSLKGNLLEDSPHRSVPVYLPPGYGSSPGRRFRTLYLLHGNSGHSTSWISNPLRWNIKTAMDSLFAAGKVREMCHSSQNH